MRWLLALVLTLWCGAASAQCVGAGGVPFNCVTGGTPQVGDLVLGGSNTSPLAGDTVAWTWGSVFGAKLPATLSSLTIGTTLEQFPASGLLVGTTDTQTLSNKTISAVQVMAAQTGVFTNTQMNTPNTFLLNGISPTTEFAATQGSNYATQALVGGALISVGSTVSQAGGLASYVQNSSTATNGVGLFINCRGIATGVQCFGINESLTDVNGASNYALDALIGNETDIECANLSTACVGYNMIGVFPNGSPGRFGYAFQASALGSNYPWQVGFNCAEGGAIVCVVANPTGSAASSNSQTVQFDAVSGNSSVNVCAIEAVALASTANLNLECQNGQIQTNAPIVMASYTVSALPGCTVADRGATAYVTDGNSPTYLSAVTGGASTPTPVFCNGSGWVFY